MLGWRLPAAIVVAALVPAPAAAATPQDVAAARQGLARAAEQARLPAGDAARYAAILDRAASLQRRLPAPRARELAGVIADVSAQAPRYDAPRALALFSMLDLNARRLGSGLVAAPGADVQDADGVVHRAFAGRGVQFHPLANFAKLNSLLAARRAEEARRLAEALLARAVPTRSGLTWEYYFPFGGGRAPWTSGMAQAVAAQALARAGLLPEAGLAYAALEPALLLQVDGREWVRIYSFNRLAVLNAQLQALLSVRDYAELAEDPAAIDLAARLEASTASLLPAFDTGAWSLYSYRGSEAALGYHTYVVSLLRRLAQRSEDPLWRATADRLDAYTKQPPVVTPLARAFPALYPVPREGFRDEWKVELTLSKLSTVALTVGGATRSFWLTRGRKTIAWHPGSLAPGLHAARLRAVDPAGNAAEVELPPLEVRVDTTPPELLLARLRGGVLTWSSRDAETPWLRLALELAGARGERRVELGRRPLRGSTAVRLPRGRWSVTLVSADSSANESRAPVGVAVGR